MARTTLTPVILTADSGATLAGTLSTGFALVTAGAGNGVTFSNLPGQSLLMVAGTAASQAGTLTVTVGQTVLGQSVTSFSVPLTLTTAAPTAVVGPFHSVLEAPGGANISVDFNFVLPPYAAVFQTPGVY
jgi:hypothetical protein